MLPGPRTDLIVHELREDSGHLVHELLFDRGTRIAITCARVSFREIFTSPQAV